jgi:hypothetical protein
VCASLRACLQPGSSSDACSVCRVQRT